MKKILAILLIFSLIGCDDKPSYIEGNVAIVYDIDYFKDTRTGLCFSIVNGYNNTMTCVPCDSVKHLIQTK